MRTFGKLTWREGQNISNKSRPFTDTVDWSSISSQYKFKLLKSKIFIFIIYFR